jgi:hypothetical protein
MARLRGFPGRHPIASAAIVCAAVSVLLLYQAWLSQQRGPHELPPLAPGSLVRPGSSAAAGAARPAPAQHPPASPTSASARPPASAGGPPALDDSAGAASNPARQPDQAIGRPPAASSDTAFGRENPFEPVTQAPGASAAATDTSTQADTAAAEIEAAIKQSEQGVGRANPFDPLIAASASGAPSSTAHTLRIRGVAGPSSPRRSGARTALPLPPVPPLDPTGPMPAPAVTAGLRLVGFVTGPTVLAVIEDGRRSYLAAPGEMIRPGLRVAAVDTARQRVLLEWQGKPIELSVAIPTAP